MAAQLEGIPCQKLTHHQGGNAGREQRNFRLEGRCVKVIHARLRTQELNVQEEKIEASQPFKILAGIRGRDLHL